MLSQRQAAANAGMSEHQQLQAVRVAHVSADAGQVEPGQGVRDGKLEEGHRRPLRGGIAREAAPGSRSNLGSKSRLCS